MSNYYSITIKDNLQYIYLTMFIMIYIVVILFYLKESNKKHYKLFEKFGETREGTNIYSRQNENLEKSSINPPNVSRDNIMPFLEYFVNNFLAYVDLPDEGNPTITIIFLPFIYV